MSVFFSPPSSPSAPSMTTTSTLSPLSIPYNLRKRKAEIEPTVESPLTKRFRKLNIRNSSSKVTKRTGSPARNPLAGYTSNGINSGATIREPWNLTPPPFQRPSSPPPAVMEVDETPYRIFVNDLDSSSDDSDPDSPAKNEKDNPIIFLSDVEREMSRIPLAVLKASSSSPSAASGTGVTKLTTARAGSGSSTDLILYRPPDRVVDDNGTRRLIMEAKERMRMMRNASSGSMDGIRTEPMPPADIMMDQSMVQFGGGLTDSPMAFTMSTPSYDPDDMVLDDL
ncbi:hypothetical protein TWF730_004723 [Orbilia blumenaviensis]|uniref:Uncharacterized protein n=1 Tax=Orbilia blumenaviensis TaxID=1796055 RepID=A0AAV9TZ73_9PEZI